MKEVLDRTDKFIEDKRREAEIRFSLTEKQIERERLESRVRFWWAIGTIIFCNVALAGYLSVIILTNH
jgi:hypothetical protein